MTQDTRYAPIELTYKSKGLTARPAQDQAPPYTFLNLFNGLERTEESMSSRYGTQIINRDPIGTPFPVNYFFTTPVTSLSRLTYLGQPYRYAGTSDGKLWRRASDTQGQYDQVQYNSLNSPLSGQPFQSVVTNCFQSSQPYLFIYDAAASIKDNGTLAQLQLTGIDPSPYTLNSQPYSPLLTLIDNFAAANTYTTSGFLAPWTYGVIVTLTSTGGDLVTDFPEFFGVQQSGSGSYGVAVGTTTAAISGVGTVSNANTYFGFASVPITGNEVVSLSINLDASVSNGAHATGTGTVTLLYSADGGASFTPFSSLSLPPGPVHDVGTITIAVPGLTNLADLQIQAQASITTLAGSSGLTTTTAALSGAVAIVAAPNVFGPVTDGMLAILGTTPSTAYAISNVVSSNFIGGTYAELLVTTQAPHGRSPGDLISIYASSNDLVDGFYQVLATPSGTTLTVTYTSNVLLSATGGTLYGGAATPATCVLTNEYSTPYPTQMSAWGFYQQVPLATASFPVSAWTGTVDVNSTATVGATVDLNLALNNQVTDDDLIVICLNVGNPAAISNIRLQFDVNASGYTSSYYYKDISPSFYQGNIQQTESAYDATQNQILADTLGLITGQVPNTTSAQLQPANLSTGQNAWATIYMRRGDFVAVGTAGASGSDWTAITGWQLVITTNTVGQSTVSANGLYLQWGYGPSSFGGVGYDYRQTYYNAATGTESNGCPIQNFNSQFGYLSSLAAPFYLRQAAQVVGQYSSDPQVTHIRIYRRGGTFASNWYQIDQIPNITRVGAFVYKDVIPDLALQQSSTLVLDNDPPVTASLQNPIATTLLAATSPPGTSFYSTYNPQTITVVQAGAVFVPGQIVDLGYATTLEQVRVITGGTGSFTAIVRLQHNAGEPINVYSIPRALCNLCALAYDQVWVGGDKNNPNYLYYSKKNQPENFGPQNYVKVGISGDTIMAVVNWRGTLFVATNKTWFSIVGGASPYPQPTGAAHGVVATGGWTQSESAIWFRAADGWREFTGANGQYATLPVELIFRPNPTPPLTPVPLADPNEFAQDVMGFYQNVVYDSYISTTNSGQRFRLAFDTNYRRYRYDDVPATAMLWEQDTNTFLVGKKISDGNFAIVQDWVGDYDDGGWSGSDLVQVPIALVTQTPYGDLGKPHFPKQFNVLETDVNTQGQTLNTTLLFDTEPPLSIVLATATTTDREKVQLKVNLGKGQEAYSMSIQHSMSVLVAPTLYQENIYAAVLAAVRSSFDTYWEKFGTDASKLVKEAYFDYTSSAPIVVSIYADGNTVPYYTFTLPTNTARAKVPMRVRFPAIKLRQFRCVGLSDGDYQFWNNPVLLWKAIKVGTGYANYEFTV